MLGNKLGSTLQYLQWTKTGPEKGGLMALTFLRNFNMPMGENGTPKSGQLVKWSWVTGLGVLAASLACWKQKRHIYGCKAAKSTAFWLLGTRGRR